MKKDSPTIEQLRETVIAMPPLARDEEGALSREQNRRLIRHVEKGGIRMLAYGENANLYHIRESEFAALLEMLAEVSGEETRVVPGVGPGYGLMMEQAEMLRGSDFAAALVLAQFGMVTEPGVVRGILDFAAQAEKPVAVQLINSNYLSVASLRRLVGEGIVSWIHNAIPTTDPGGEAFLEELRDAVDPGLLVSARGEQGAIVHLRDYGMSTFASGAAAIAPRLSQNLLRALHEKHYGEAEEFRGIFKKLEGLRRELGSVPVLHRAVTYAGVAEMGPLQPLLSDVEERYASRVREAAQTLLAENNS